MGEKRNKTQKKKVLLARSKFTSTEKIISRALTDAEISHEEFALLINVKQNYLRLKESIWIKNSYNATLKSFIEYGKRTIVDEMI